MFGFLGQNCRRDLARTTGRGAIVTCASTGQLWECCFKGRGKKRRLACNKVTEKMLASRRSYDNRRVTMPPPGGYRTPGLDTMQRFWRENVGPSVTIPPRAPGIIPSGRYRAPHVPELDPRFLLPASGSGTAHPVMRGLSGLFGCRC